MALRKIYKEGEAILKKKAKPVTKFDNRLALLVGDMIETVKDANGVGLAAPQVGILKRIIVIDAGEDMGVVELINPEIIRRIGEQVYYEGCLSYPGYYGNVGRPQTVVVRAHNRNGEETIYEADGLYAVACCHEADHLEGIMFMPKVKGPLYTLEEVKAMREKSKTEKTGDEKTDNAGITAGGGAGNNEGAGKTAGGANKTAGGAGQTAGGASKTAGDGDNTAGGETPADTDKTADGYMRRINMI